MTYLPAIIETTTTSVTVTQTVKQVRIFVKRARTKSEIIDRIRDRSACVADIHLFLVEMGAHLNAEDLHEVQHALAVARYREGMSLSLTQLALLIDRSEARTLKICRRLGVQIADRVANHQASRVMSAMMED